MGVMESDVDNADDPSTYIMRNLYQGEALTDKINNLSWYSFQLNLQEEVQAISVSLQSKTGNYIIAVNNWDKKPRFD